MGGAIGAKFLEDYPEYFDRAVLSSPMLEINTGKICPGNPDQQNRGNIMDKGYDRLLISAKVSAEAEMHRCKNRIKGIGSYVGTA